MFKIVSCCEKDFKPEAVTLDFVVVPDIDAETSQEPQMALLSAESIPVCVLSVVEVVENSILSDF